MSTIGPSSSTENFRKLQNLVAITPPEKAKKPSSKGEHYQSNIEKQQRFYESFWEGLLNLFIKIPFIKNLTLFIWRCGLGSLQRETPIKNPKSLLFSSSIEIPKWFNDEMRVQSSLTLKEHLIAELKMVTEKAPCDLNTLVLLSQIKVSRELYSYPLIIKELEKSIKETIYSVIQKIQRENPGEPLQLHLGGHSYENPLEQSPLSGLFIQAFADCLQEHGKEMHIRILHIHGPCDNNDALKFLILKLKSCPTLYHLHLDLDEESSKKTFNFLGNALRDIVGLEIFDFQNYTNKHKFWVLTKDWNSLVDTINAHKKLHSLNFRDLPSPPDYFRKQLEGYEITLLPNSQGFCLKKLHVV